jgi:hypothetical protein
VTLTGRVIVLGAVIGAGLMIGGVFGRVRRSKCYADAGGGHTAILDAAGTFIRCENEAGATVDSSLCAGYTPCRPSASSASVVAAVTALWSGDDSPEIA